MKRVFLLAVCSLLWASASHAQDLCAPGKPTISVDAGKTTIVVSWSEVGDDCATGTATTYEIRRSTSAITDTNWQGASVVASGTPGSSGSGECVSFHDLPCNTTYYWAVFVIDEAGNRSPISNVVQRGTNACNSNLEVEC